MKKVILALLILSFFAVQDANAIGKKKKKKIAKVIQTAKNFYGTPYRTGGASKSGMDCSGLTSTAFGAVDVELPHNAKLQSKEGRARSIRSLKEGDLVFFATGKKRRKINHVGIISRVVNSDQIYMIHSSVSRGVIESNIMDDYYRPKLRRARRVF